MKTRQICLFVKDHNTQTTFPVARFLYFSIQAQIQPSVNNQLAIIVSPSTFQGVRNGLLEFWPGCSPGHGHAQIEAA